jgi:acyl carrier protein
MFEKLVEIIADQLDIDPDMISGDSKIMEDLGADSLDVVEMLMAIEDAFGYSVPDEDVEDLITVNDVASYLENQMN